MLSETAAVSAKGGGVVINFKLNIPTEIFFGPGSISMLGVETSALGGKALLVGYSEAGPLAATLNRAHDLLQKSGVEIVAFQAVEPNPRHSTCDRGAEMAREEGCDVIVAVGGGSVMDAAKAVSASASTGRSCWDFVRRPGGLAPVTAALPIVAVPTTAATGSEANSEAVISNDETNEKCVMGDPLLAPRVAVCDPELHLSIPAETTADGCVDILSHCLESYLSGEDDCTLQDRITEGLINVVLEWGPVAVAEGDSLRARRELQYASLWGISELTHAGRGGSWLMHNIEHALSGRYDIPHGRGMAIIIPRVMRKVFARHAPVRLAQLGRRCFDVPGGGVEETAAAAVDAFVDWLAGIGRDLTLADAGIGEEMFEAMADDVIRNDGDGVHYRSIVKLDRDDIVDILSACREPN